MKTRFLFISLLVAILVAAFALALTSYSVQAQGCCTDASGRPIPCPGQDKKTPTPVPPQATATASPTQTPEPTNTSLPISDKPTEDPTKNAPSLQVTLTPISIPEFSAPGSSSETKVDVDNCDWKDGNCIRDFVVNCVTGGGEVISHPNGPYITMICLTEDSSGGDPTAGMESKTCSVYDSFCYSDFMLKCLDKAGTYFTIHDFENGTITGFCLTADVVPTVPPAPGFPWGPVGLVGIGILIGLLLPAVQKFANRPKRDPGYHGGVFVSSGMNKPDDPEPRTGSTNPQTREHILLANEPTDPSEAKSKPKPPPPPPPPPGTGIGNDLWIGAPLSIQNGGADSAQMENNDGLIIGRDDVITREDKDKGNDGKSDVLVTSVQGPYKLLPGDDTTGLSEIDSLYRTDHPEELGPDVEGPFYLIDKVPTRGSSTSVQGPYKLVFQAHVQYPYWLTPDSNILGANVQGPFYRKARWRSGKMKLSNGKRHSYS